MRVIRSAKLRMIPVNLKSLNILIVPPHVHSPTIELACRLLKTRKEYKTLTILLSTAYYKTCKLINSRRIILT
ncbi:hypothetical protein D1872_210720 [compost metagenome]